MSPSEASGGASEGSTDVGSVDEVSLLDAPTVGAPDDGEPSDGEPPYDGEPRSSGPSKVRAALATIDQGISGLGSFALTVSVARVADVEFVGIFALCYLTFQILTTLVRVSMTQAYMVERGTVGSDGLAADHSLVGATSWVGLLGGLVCGAVSVAVLRGEALTVALLLSAAFPIAVVVDCFRFIAIAREVPSKAVAIDSFRVVGFVATVAVWTVVGQPDGVGVIVWWVVVSGVGVAVSLAVLRLRLQRPAIVAWWRSLGRVAMAFGGENLLTRLAAYSVTYGLVWFASVPAVAGFRAGSSLTNLITIFFAAIPMVLMPHYRGQMTAATEVVPRIQLFKIAGAAAVYVCVLCALGSVVLLALPAAMGKQIFGDTWVLARESLPGLLFWTAGAGAVAGPMMVLRATARVKLGVLARAVSSVAVVVLGFAGAILGEAPGAAWGLGIGSWIGVAAYFWVLWADGDWDPASDLIASPDDAVVPAPT